MADEVRELQRQVRALRLQMHQLLDALGIGISGESISAPPVRIQRTAVAVTALAAGTNQDVPIVWPRLWFDQAYSVIISIVSSTVALGALSATLQSGSKTVTGATVTVANTGASPIALLVLDIVGIRM